MPRNPVIRFLDQLDETRKEFGPGAEKRVERLLVQLARCKFTDAEALIRFHESLLFLRAYPHSVRILRKVEKELSSFAERVKLLEATDADTSAFIHPDSSGIVQTSVIDTFSFNIVRWLLQKHSNQITLDWEWFEDENRLAATWPRFMPLLEEDAFVEANVPYREWLRTAKGRGSTDIAWLIKRISSMPLTEQEKAELYDSLKLYVRWTPSYRASRTGMKLPVLNVFYHSEPLIQRRDISFLDELQAPPPKLSRLSAKQGEAMINIARETSTMRYRELYGFTHGDSRRVFKASLGRGVDLFVMGVPPVRRLPLRAYHAAMIFKNGVPVGYFEGLSFVERMESGFNFYYSFREGETAWIYARTLNVFHHLLGVTVFSIDPYQVGYKNDEGLVSGAFWFYRKLGFRPTQKEIMRLTIAEERKIASRRSYRTPRKILRQLAEGSMVLEVAKPDQGDWDRFQIRKIGLSVQRLMASEFEGDAARMQAAAEKEIGRVLDISPSDLNEVELKVFNYFAVVLRLIPDLDRWSVADKDDLVQIIRAKTGASETLYLKLLQKHARFRKALIKLGS